MIISRNVKFSATVKKMSLIDLTLTDLHEENKNLVAPHISEYENSNWNDLDDDQIINIVQKGTVPYHLDNNPLYNLMLTDRITLIEKLIKLDIPGLNFEHVNGDGNYILFGIDSCDAEHLDNIWDKVIELGLDYTKRDIDGYNIIINILKQGLAIVDCGALCIFLENNDIAYWFKYIVDRVPDFVTEYAHGKSILYLIKDNEYLDDEQKLILAKYIKDQVDIGTYNLLSRSRPYLDSIDNFEIDGEEIINESLPEHDISTYQHKEEKSKYSCEIM